MPDSTRRRASKGPRHILTKSEILPSISDSPTDVEGEPKATLFSTTLSLCCSMLGLGVSNLPWIFESVGILPAIFILGIFAMMSQSTMQILGTMFLHSRHFSLMDLTEEVFQSKRLAIFVELVNAVHPFLIACAFVNSVDVSALNMIKHIHPLHFFVKRPFVRVLSLLIPLSLPLCLQTSLNSPYLMVFSFIGTLSVLVLPLAFSYQLHHHSENTSVGGMRLFSTPSSISVAISIISLSYVNHHNCSSFVRELSINRRTGEALSIFENCVRLSTGIALVLYVCVGLIGYLAFRESMERNVMLNLSGPEMIYRVANGWVLFNCLVTYPFHFYAARSSVMNILNSFQKSSEFPENFEPDVSTQNEGNRLLWWVVTIGLFGGTVLGGVLITHLEALNVIRAFTTNVLVVFIFPAVLFLYPSWEHALSDDSREFRFRISDVFRTPKFFPLQVISFYSLVVGGVCCFCGFVALLNI